MTNPTPAVGNPLGMRVEYDVYPRVITKDGSFGLARGANPNASPTHSKPSSQPLDEFLQRLGRFISDLQGDVPNVPNGSISITVTIHLSGSGKE